MYEIRHYSWDKYAVVKVIDNIVERIMFVGPITICDRVLTNIVDHGIVSTQTLAKEEI